MNNIKISIILVILIIICFTSSHASSRNGWLYQDPYPTSNTLLAVKFMTPQNGWFAGDAGTILHTQDGGNTWESQESGTEETITGIAFVNEKQGWAIGAQGLIIHTDDGGKTWINQTRTNQYLNKVVFLNEKEGWVAGPAGMFHTVDGGLHWVHKGFAATGSIASIYFINSKIGWVMADQVVYRTENGGETWNKSALPRDEYPVFPAPPELVSTMLGNRGDIYFIDSKNGWAVVGFNLIFHTKDGGKTWVNRLHTNSASYNLGSISFIDSKKGCAAGSAILCTADGGNTWSERSLTAKKANGKIEGYWSASDIYSISFPSDTTIGWAAGADGLIVKTENGGSTWKLVSHKDECGRNVFFINNKTGWFVDVGHNTYICRTDDGGHSRHKQDVGINVRNVFFVDGKTGWAVGARKKAIGAQMTGRRPGEVWAAIKFTEDGGKTWQTQYEELINKDLFFGGLLNAYFINRNTGWAIGEKGYILFTENGGKTWSHQNNDYYQAQLTHGKNDDYDIQLGGIQFVTPEIGWVIGIESASEWTGIILHTVDGGKHWQTQYKINDIGLTGIFFSNKDIGWVTGLGEQGGPGMLLHTSDGGSNWDKKELGDVGYSDPFYFDMHRGIVSTDKGRLFITQDFGKTWRTTRNPIRTYPVFLQEIF